MGFLSNSCTDPTQTRVIPFGVCVPVGRGVYIIFNNGTSDGTANVLVENIFLSSDCSGPAIVSQNETYSSACSQTSSTPPAGFLKTVSIDASCASPSVQRGYLSGICYKDFDPYSPFKSFEFLSCNGAESSYTLLAYSASTNCTGASENVTSSYSLNCNIDSNAGASYYSQCIVGQNTNSSQMPSPVSSGAILSRKVPRAL